MGSADVLHASARVKMGLVLVLKLFLIIADKLATYLGNKQLMDAGEAKSVSAQLKGAMDATQRAIAARNAVRDDADSVRNDPFNRDNTDRKQ